MNKLVWVVVIVAVVGGGLMVSKSMMKGPVTDTTETESTTAAKTGSEVAGTVVEIKDFGFAQKTLTVKVGTTVTWMNKDLTGHSATADDKSFDTGVLAQGESGSFTFTKAGTYGYHCTPHPNMKATIVVEE